MRKYHLYWNTLKYGLMFFSKSRRWVIDKDGFKTAKDMGVTLTEKEVEEYFIKFKDKMGMVFAWDSIEDKLFKTRS